MSKREAESARSRRLLVVFAAALAGAWLLTTSRRDSFPDRPIARLDAEKAAPSALRNPIGDTTPGTVATPPSYQDFLDALTREFPFGRERQGALREMLEGAPPEAIEGLLRLSFGTETLNDISHVLIERLATLAPEAALAFAREKAFGVEPPWWHSVIGGLPDPRVALGDILALPASDVRTRFLGHMVFQLGADNPDAAMRFALTGTPPEARGPAISNAVFAASRLDYADGFERALLYGPEAGDAGLVKRIAVDWALDDYGAASARILALPDDDTRQTALAGLASAAVSRDPDAALALIAQLRDASARQALYVAAAKQLYLKDPAAAAPWIERNPELSAANKEALREFAERVGR